jgi:hypothetical protein
MNWNLAPLINETVHLKRDNSNLETLHPRRKKRGNLGLIGDGLF